jgi:alginate production protein
MGAARRGDCRIGSDGRATGGDPGDAGCTRRRRRASLATGLATLLTVLSGPARPAPSAADVFRLDDPPETRYRVAPGLTFGAEIELDYRFRRNRDLDERRAVDTSRLSPELSLALSFDPAPAFQAYLNVALSQDFVWVGGRGSSDDVALELKEAYLALRQVPLGLSLRVGRQRFEDEREWLYDEELDAVRLRYARGSFALELSASRGGLVKKDLLATTEEDRVDNYILQASYALPGSIELEGYVIVRDDRAVDRGQPVFAGLRSWGEPIADLDYWLELAYAGGRDGAKRVGGWAVDLGVTYELQRGPRPGLTLGFAFGSGDRNPDDRYDRSFRQTGLQENEGDFGGSASFQYYGEVLNPELSNLFILTVGLGIRPTEQFSLDLVYHYYMQHRASRTLRNAGITAEPSGRSRDLGSEVDFIVGLTELLGRIDFKAAVGYFIPGAAFAGRTDGAWAVGVEVQFRF